MPSALEGLPHVRESNFEESGRHWASLSPEMSWGRCSQDLGGQLTAQTGAREGAGLSLKVDGLLPQPTCSWALGAGALERAGERWPGLLRGPAQLCSGGDLLVGCAPRK